MIRDKENRIQRAFYEDLFLMLANSDRRQITAREIAERHEEKLLMLGPVLERIHGELLDPLIDVTFARCLSAVISAICVSVGASAEDGCHRWIGALDEFCIDTGSSVSRRTN